VVESRAYDALRAVYGDDVLDVDRDCVDGSRRLYKAESHIRFDLDKKNDVVETLERSKGLIEFGGNSEIDAAQERFRQGWVEASVDADRWELLGFDDRRFSTMLKCYQVRDWFKRSASDPLRYPKLEASFSGVDSGKLPHIDEWNDVVGHLREIVATHAHWAGVDAGDLVADDYFDGPAAKPFTYGRPDGRRDMLRRRNEQRGTAIYREALKESTMAVYDLLNVVASERGATYDTLVEKTGLAYSTVRYHVARLVDEGVLERLSNPVLVVFENDDLLERARDVLEECYPGDDVEDRDERAEERRERRENDESGPAAQEDDSDEADEKDDRIGFRYLDELGISMPGVYDRWDRDELGDRDIRVRVDELPERLR
jgi:hypothetical protein